MRIYIHRKGGRTFGMAAPELRRKIQEHVNDHGMPITLKFLQQFTNTDFLYGAMRTAQSGRTNHPILQRWLDEHPLDETEAEPEQMALAL